MLYQECPAPPGLRPFATQLWFVQTVPRARYEKILPGPSAHLILNLSNPYRLITPSGDGNGYTATEVSTGFYSGLQRSYLVSENPDRIFNVGARLTPFGLSAFTSRPPSEFQGKVVDAQGVLPGLADLRPRLLQADPQEAFAVLGGFLERSLRPERRLDPRTARAVETLAREDVEIGRLAAGLNISTSTLERIMMRDCGFTAKAYSDVCRFFRFVNAAAAMPEGSVPGRDLLALADYYDQPHLIRAFRRFSGFTPTEYLRVVQSYGAEYATFVPLEQVSSLA
ncbi:helix-turn-helix domain-containing protein [Paenarthrobacter sp. NPDC089714]|uniref:helix-turn-helix domain-containing protein n=1 Tax=Paenarthrobacter sp. NPDC089714 TaxID=3364377 RepID=UPI0037F57582